MILCVSRIGISKQEYLLHVNNKIIVSKFNLYIIAFTTLDLKRGFPGHPFVKNIFTNKIIILFKRIIDNKINDHTLQTLFSHQ